MTAATVISALQEAGNYLSRDIVYFAIQLIRHFYDEARAFRIIGEKTGFSWGGDWKSIVDKPHFQWDAGGKYTGSMILNKKYPPDMPLYEQEDEMEKILSRSRRRPERPQTRS